MNDRDVWMGLVSVWGAVALLFAVLGTAKGWRIRPTAEASIFVSWLITFPASIVLAILGKCSWTVPLLVFLVFAFRR